MSGSIVYRPSTPSEPAHICDRPRASWWTDPSGKEGWQLQLPDGEELITGTVWLCECGIAWVWGPRGVRPDWWTEAELRSRAGKRLGKRMRSFLLECLRGPWCNVVRSRRS